METPNLPRAIFAKDFETVYEPAEDTFLLLDALEKEVIELCDKPSIVLECGSGSGTVVTAISKTLGITSIPKFIIATDINSDACITTKKCATYHNQQNIQVIRTNLAESLVDRLENKVDLLIFNPPYVPTDYDEVNPKPSNPIYLSWAGGSNGRDLIDIFLNTYVSRLLSKPDGVAFLVALDRNNIGQLINHLLDRGIRGSVVMQRRAGFEQLHIIKYQWMNLSSDS